MAQTYIELDVLADDAVTEQLIGLLSQLGVEGFWEDGATLKCYMRSERWDPTLLEEIRSLAAMVARSSRSPVPTVTVRTLEDRNWNEEWERTIKPIHATDGLVIRPTWQPYQPAPGEHVITIDPKMSFGTGYHETTRLMLRLLERFVCPAMRLLDVGTGTGVLAIAGIKLGAASAVAVDNDPWSYSNAQENARLNGVENSVEVTLGDIDAAPSGPFDVVASNIQRSVIERMLPELVRRLAPEGVLLLSGLLASDREPIAVALEKADLMILEECAENEWIAIATRRSPPPSLTI